MAHARRRRPRPATMLRLIACAGALLLIGSAGALTISAQESTISAQESQIPRDEYFRLMGLSGEFEAMQTFLSELLRNRRPDLSEDRRGQMAEFFAFVMTASGLTAGAAAALEADGVDIIHAITADIRPFSEQSLLADLVVVGDVADAEVIDDTNDGYYSSALVSVRWILKGHAPGDTIVVRLREPRAGSRRDIRPEPNRSYLLLLSNGMYRYGVANHMARHEGWLPTETLPPHYSIYRIYALDDGRLDWEGFTRDETDHALDDIRRVEHVLSLYFRR